MRIILNMIEASFLYFNDKLSAILSQTTTPNRDKETQAAQKCRRHVVVRGRANKRKLEKKKKKRLDATCQRSNLVQLPRCTTGRARVQTVRSYHQTRRQYRPSISATLRLCWVNAIRKRSGVGMRDKTVAYIYIYI